MSPSVTGSNPPGGIHAERLAVSVITSREHNMTPPNAPSATQATGRSPPADETLEGLVSRHLRFYPTASEEPWGDSRNQMVLPSPLSWLTPQAAA